MKRNRSLAAIAVIMIIITGVSCSTKKNTFTRRAYHNLTAHYNAYFNGNEAYKEGVTELAKKSKDNFIRIIPVFQYGTKEDAQSVYNFFDRAIEKGSIVIQRHSIFIKRVEHVKWIDDAYLLIGKSYLYKQEYDLAVQTFNFIRDRYKNNAVVYDAVLYQIRTYSQTGRFLEAEALISLVDRKIEKNKSTRHVEKLFPLVMADYYLQQEEYNKSVEYLLQGLRLNKSKKIRTRLTFILAQVFQRTGDPAKATEYYKKVLKYNPVYEMAFAAKINMAKCFDASAGDSKTIKKLLTRMLKDDKNKDFLDQIYYALAEVNLKEKEDTLAISNLKKSARSSVSNNYQKGLSYLKLGELYYQKTDYKPSQMFYDSACMFLPKDYPNFSQIESKKNTLTDLVKNINIVELEDSLQRLGKMPYNERMAHIDRIIAAILKEEQRKAQEEADRQMALANIKNLGFDNQSNQSGNQWYFYNPQMLSMGAAEFTKKWGNRKLEDLWRLSNKVASDFESGSDAQKEDTLKSDSTAQAFDPKNRNTYIKAIPNTPEAFQKSDKRIMEALFNIGVIYKEGLNDYDKSVKAFENLFKRYPDNPYRLQSYYYLFRIYDETEKPSNANYYKNLILTEYPNSDYAKIISDPEYYKKLDSIGHMEEVFYGQVFQAYKNSQFNYVISSSDSAMKRFKDNKVIPKFAFIRAISLGKVYGDSLMIGALREIVSRYKSSDVSKMAQDLITIKTGKSGQALKANASSDTTGGKGAILTESPYVYDPEGFHFYISVFDAVKVKIGEIKNLFSDHNTTLYKLDKLTVNSMFLTNDLQVITVNRFENKLKALDYYTSINKDAAIMAKLGPANMKHFVVSANNYTTFYRLKNVQQYLEFFNANYLNQ